MKVRVLLMQCMEAAETTFRGTILGPRVDAPCILQGILIRCNLCGLKFVVLRYASVVYCFYRSLCKKAAFFRI